MSCDFINLALPGVQKIQAYQPGKPIEELQRELGIEQVIKLASNENPLGASPAVITALQLALSHITRYPDGNAFLLKQALAAHLKVDIERLTIGNGSNDILELMGRAYLHPGAEVIFSQHAFAIYALVTQACGAKAVEVPAKAWGHDLVAIAAAITSKTRLIFLANPNNPTGSYFDRHALENFLCRVPDNVLVVLDEAYYDYVEEGNYPNGLDYIEDYPQLIIARTFSKAYGLAALRVGYSISHPMIADILNRVRQPFNVNMLAQVAAIAALEDQNYLQHSRVINRQGLQQLCQGFRALGLGYIPSVANFVTLDLKRNAGVVYEALLRKGVIVRPIASYGMPCHLRVSVGLPAENSYFLQALQDVL